LLFMTSEWPWEFSEEYELATTRLQRVKATEKRIKHFIKTGE